MLNKSFQHPLGGKELWQMFYNSLVTPQTRCTTSQKSLSTQKKTLFNANLHLSLSLACKCVHVSDETNSSRKNSIWILLVRDLFVRACRNSIHLFVLSTSNQQRSIIEIVISLNFIGLLGQERNQQSTTLTTVQCQGLRKNCVFRVTLMKNQVRQVGIFF